MECLRLLCLHVYLNSSFELAELITIIVDHIIICSVAPFSEGY